MEFASNVDKQLIHIFYLRQHVNMYYL